MPVALLCAFHRHAAGGPGGKPLGSIEGSLLAWVLTMTLVSLGVLLYFVVR